MSEDLSNQRSRGAGGGSSPPPVLQTLKPFFQNMKTQINARSDQHAADPADQRTGGIRPAAARTLEHRYERRKIREQLRRLDWALNVEDGVYS